jgi:hypothetical protein
VPAYANNQLKRVVKSPKVHFIDSGLASYLLNVDVDGAMVIQASNSDTGKYIRVIDDKVNLKWFGAIGDGKFDNTEALTKFLKFLNKGYEGYIPKGDYYIDSAIRIKIQNNIKIRAEYNAKIIAGNLETPMLTFDGNGKELEWSGGRLDTQNSKFVPARQSGTALALRNLSKISLKDITFYAKAHYEDAKSSRTGDSGITIISSKNAIITNNLFVGFPDAGIYLSGGASADASDDGENYIISDNIFENCNIGVTIKRQLKDVLINGNLFTGGKIGVSTFDTNTGGNYLRPGESISIVNNIFKNTESTAIELRYGAFNLVTGNIILDWGYTRNNILTPRLRPAIWLRGVSYSTVKNNLISMKKWVRTRWHKNIYEIGYKTIPSSNNNIERQMFFN